MRLECTLDPVQNTEQKTSKNQEKQIKNEKKNAFFLFFGNRKKNIELNVQNMRRQKSKKYFKHL